MLVVSGGMEGNESKAGGGGRGRGRVSASGHPFDSD